MYKVLYFVLLIFPLSLFATEEYELTITIPVSHSGTETELKKVTFKTYYSRLETQVSAVTWDPCKAKDSKANCELINPLHNANLKVLISAYNANDMKHPEGCFIEIDYTQYKPLTNKLKNVLKTKNEKVDLHQLVVKSLQYNTANSNDYLDCELRVKGIKDKKELAELNIKDYLNPVIPACQQRTIAGRNQARILNDKGMDYYRNKNWFQSEKSFRRAAELDCNNFIARTNLASVLAIQKKFEHAQAVLWRAAKLDKERTLKKLETDSDYRLLKQYVNFYSAASPIGVIYKNYCYQSVSPDEVDSELKNFLIRSSLKNKSKYFSVATRYLFEADFNNNGIPDKVYPLVTRHLHSLLVVFDGDKLESKGCSSTPLQRNDLSGIYKDDPCKIKIFAESNKDKRAIRLQTDHININRLVCQ